MKVNLGTAAAGSALWRIAVEAPNYGADDLSGRGAEASGGRWNRLGTPLVYASGSRALACLETVLHLAGKPLPFNRYLVRIDVPDDLWSLAVELDAALPGWDAEPAGRASLDWGTAWARGRTSLLARVPSIAVPEEDNVLINPSHPDIARLSATKLRQWIYEARFAR